ncbi:MAG: hypothetical protein AAGB24_08815 [Bacteroidota bacterium]
MRRLAKQRYLDRKRQTILNLGYDYIAFKSRTKKSLRTLKKIIQNNACHFEGAVD